MRLVIYNRLRPGAAHLLPKPATNFSKTLCGRTYPGVLGKIVIYSDDLHLCGVCQIVLECKKYDRSIKTGQG